MLSDGLGAETCSSSMVRSLISVHFLFKIFIKSLLVKYYIGPLPPINPHLFSLPRSSPPSLLVSTGYAYMLTSLLVGLFSSVHFLVAVMKVNILVSLYCHKKIILTGSLNNRNLFLILEPGSPRSMVPASSVCGEELLPSCPHMAERGRALVSLLMRIPALLG